MSYPGYQSIKVNDTEYVSSTKFKSHAEARVWIAALLKHLDAQSNDVRGRPSIQNRQPSSATVWP